MLIAFAGLPSAGKSTAATALAVQLGAQSFVEPEEDQWPEAVRERERDGRFTALTWFRSVRVSQLNRAAAAARSEGIAVVDSYYDVLLSQYIGTPPFAWLIDRDDPYFPLARAMAELDWRYLPRADVLVLLRLDEPVWNTFMERRGRDFDRAARLKEQFAMQPLIEQACREVETAHGTRLVVVDQEDSSATTTAARVFRQLAAPA